MKSGRRRGQKGECGPAAANVFRVARAGLVQAGRGTVRWRHHRGKLPNIGALINEGQSAGSECSSSPDTASSVSTGRFPRPRRFGGGVGLGGRFQAGVEAKTEIQRTAAQGVIKKKHRGPWYGPPMPGFFFFSPAATCKSSCNSTMPSASSFPALMQKCIFSSGQRTVVRRPPTPCGSEPRDCR